MAALSAVSGVPLERCEAYNHGLGGGFGRRGGTQDYVRQAAAIAQQSPGTPVKMIWSREEDQGHDFDRPIGLCRLTAGLDRNGNLTALHIRLSGQSINAYLAPHNIKDGKDRRQLQGLWKTLAGDAQLGYTVPNLLIEYAMRNTHVPVGPWRGTVPRNDPDARMGWYIIIGSVPIVVFGLLFQDAIETSLRHLYITAAMLAGFAILLGVADRLGRKRKELRELTLRDGLLFGLAQSLALVPGVSRSGGTITMGLLLGYTREAAARYSFLLAIPAVFGSGFYQLLGADPAPDAPGAGATAIATVVAFGVGFLVIIAFLKIVSTYSYMPFVVYRIVLAALVVAGVATGVLDPLGAAAGAE